MTSELFIKMALDAWYSYIDRTDKLFAGLSDEQLAREVSPGRNRGIYLLGHLACVHDRMLPLLGFEAQRYPHLDDPFHDLPDRAVAVLPPASELRTNWRAVNEALADHFSGMSSQAWFEKHTAVSQEDFSLQPHRNKLNVVLNRTGHLASHYGQLLFLKEK
jgi:hypothetical protein